MPWTSKILRQFRQIPYNPSEADFRGPYNKLLYSLFPGDTDYTVFPRYEPGSYESPTARFLFDILYDDKPVFILEHRAPQYFQCGSERDDADLKLRQRIEYLRRKSSSIFGAYWQYQLPSTPIAECPLPVFHAVSAFGTRLCFYRMHHDQEIQPPFICDSESATLRVTGLVPQNGWDCDILKEEGEKRFKSTIEEIKQACAAL